MTATWTTVSTGAAGDQITATNYNAIVNDLSFLRDPPHGYYALSTAGANITTTSTSMVDITGVTTTFTTQGNPVEIILMCRANTTNARFDFLIDGVSVTGDSDGLGAVTPASTFGNNTIIRLAAPTAGSHVFKAQWRVSTGTGTIYAAGLLQFLVREIGTLT